jgi:hypothetical protein
MGLLPMPDLGDYVQALQLAEIEHANARQTVRVGATACTERGCNERISAARQKLGARLCLEHQQECEARDAHLSTWRRR